LLGNTINDNEDDGIEIGQASSYWSLWNNTIKGNDNYDIYFSSTGSTGNYAVNTEFETIYVNSNSTLTIKEYFILDVNDASGENMSGIDIKVMENDVQKYATSYFGGSDSKTDSSGTVATFLINNKIYDGSSTSELIPTYILLLIKNVATVPDESVLESLPPKYEVAYFWTSFSITLMSIPLIFSPEASLTSRMKYSFIVRVEFELT
jgi:hypothetical protein